MCKIKIKRKLWFWVFGSPDCGTEVLRRKKTYLFADRVSQRKVDDNTGRSVKLLRLTVTVQG